MISPQDTRDYIFDAPTLTPTTIDHDWDVTTITSKVDLRQHTGAIEDQTITNSCIGKTVISACEVLLSQAGVFRDLSSLFVYYNARAQYGTVTDSGTNFVSALSQATKRGVCDLNLWPYDPTKVNDTPTDAAYNDGLTRLVTRYERIGAIGKDAQGNNQLEANRVITDARIALHCGYPVLFAMGLHNSFNDWRGDVAKTIYKQPVITSSSEGYMGHHAMLAVGYDNVRKCFIVENSWGTGWGDGGYALIDYDTFGENAAANDSFIVREFAGIRREIPESLYISRSMQPLATDQQIRDYVIPMVDSAIAYLEKVTNINAKCREFKISRVILARAVGYPLHIVNRYLDGLWT